MSRRTRWRWWAVRAIGLFLAVNIVGWFGGATLVAYLTALFVVILDAARVAR